MTKKTNGKARQTKDRGKSDRSNYANSTRGLAEVKGNSRCNENLKNSARHSASKGGIVSFDSSGVKTGGILSQRLLAIKTQLAFHEEQIKQLGQEYQRLKVLHEEFTKAESEASDQTSHDESE